MIYLNAYFQKIFSFIMWPKTSVLRNAVCDDIFNIPFQEYVLDLPNLVPSNVSHLLRIRKDASIVVPRSSYKHCWGCMRYDGVMYPCWTSDNVWEYTFWTKFTECMYVPVAKVLLSRNCTSCVTLMVYLSHANHAVPEYLNKKFNWYKLLSCVILSYTL